ncbi:MAG: MaoC family dehydratase [Halanaeroarchaeum sp.]
MPVATPGDTATAERTITTADIRQFADITGDHNRIHTDEAYADETLFGGIIAHGMLSAGVISAAVAKLPGDVIYLTQDLQFEAPVRPDDRIVGEATVVEDLGDDRLQVETVASVPDRNVDPVIDGEATVLSIPHPL